MKNLATKKLRIAGVHFVISFITIAPIVFLISKYWFPFPTRELMGGMQLILLIVVVNFICGPLLTAVVFNDQKSCKELGRDLTLVVIIQLLVLGYGIHTLSYARPVALVHEVDRFRFVSFADLDEDEFTSRLNLSNLLGFSPPQIFGIRSPTSNEEMFSSINASLQGVEPSQRPNWWQEYKLSVPKVLKSAHFITELRDKHPTKTELIQSLSESAAADFQPGETTDPESLRWLPLVSRRSTDWVVFLDPTTARVRGYVHLDGF